MEEFAYEKLRRAPDVEADNLFAFDATDRMLAERGLSHIADRALSGADVAVIGDGYGAITLRLAASGIEGVRVHQDLITGRRALQNNAAELGLSGFEPRELDETLLTGVRLVLLQLPKALAELEEIADAVARWASPDVVLVAGGRVKHMTLAQNEVLGRSFGSVQAERAAQKSRLVIAAEPLPVPEHPPYPVSAEVTLPVADPVAEPVAHPVAEPVEASGTPVAQPVAEPVEASGNPVTQPVAEPVEASGNPVTQPVAEPVEASGNPVARPVAESVEASGNSGPSTGSGTLILCAHGGAFAGARLDIGTRALLDALAASRSSHPHTVVDLGCGTGALAAVYARTHPEARVIATDRSAAAVASARATMTANGLADPVEVTHDDAGSELPDAGIDLVLLNPPFHLGNSIHTGAATRMFEAAARILRPGGELWTVYNSTLAYRRQLTALIGRTEQIHRTPKFTVTRSVRR